MTLEEMTHDETLRMTLAEKRQEDYRSLTEKLFSREVVLNNVNIALETFVLDHGIRRYLLSHAERIGLLGLVKRTCDHQVYVRFQGTREQLG
jgi:hypothetical protein